MRQPTKEELAAAALLWLRAYSGSVHGFARAWWALRLQSGTSPTVQDGDMRPWFHASYGPWRSPFWYTGLGQ